MRPNRTSAITLVLVVCCAAFALAAGMPSAPAPGSVIEDFKLPDYSGNEHSLLQYSAGKGVILIFISTRCPVSNAYNERMVKLAGDYQAKGFQFLGINSNKAEDPAEMATHAKSHAWNFPVLKDTGNLLADRLGATVTPEVYLIDSKGVLRYHGRIDDSQDAAAVKDSDLKTALEAILESREISKTEAKAFGCTIKRVG